MLLHKQLQSRPVQQAPKANAQSHLKPHVLVESKDHHARKGKRTAIHILLAQSTEFKANSPFQVTLSQLLYNKWITCASCTVCDFHTRITRCHLRFRRRIAVLHVITQPSHIYLLLQEKKSVSILKGTVAQTDFEFWKHISYSSAKRSENDAPHLGEHHCSGDHQISVCQPHSTTLAFLGGPKAVHSSPLTLLQSDKLKTCKPQLNILLL